MFTPPPLTRRQWRVLLILSSATFFDYYDITIISIALKQIQADLGIGDDSIGYVGALVLLGKIPSVFVAMAADRFGRRPVLLVTVVAYTVLTGLTGLAPGVVLFVVLQFLARTFATAEVALANVVVAEEIGATHRGWALGFMGTLAGLGSGVAYVLFAFVDVLPGGWRALYLLGLLPLLLVVYARRGLPETERFLESSKQRRAQLAAAGRIPEPELAAVLRPTQLLELLRHDGRRFGVMAVVVFAFFCVHEAVYFLTPKFLQDAHGWKPYHIALLAPFGILTVAMNLVGGWLGDRFGRRRISFVFLLLTLFAGLLLFNGSGYALLAFAMVLTTSAAAAARTNLYLYSAELFSTVRRSTAGGALMALNSLGGMFGLVMHSVLYSRTGSHSISLTLLTLVLVAAIVAIFWVPETSGRQLEEITRD